jgi:hypothetical protein
VHITPNVPDVHDGRIPSDATVHNTWRLPREQFSGGQFQERGEIAC